jgi:hypothetical protein
MDLVERTQRGLKDTSYPLRRTFITSSPNVSGVMVRMRHVARMGAMSNAYKILIGKPEGKDQWVKAGRRGTKRFVA